jgi:hypothetical protein
MRNLPLFPAVTTFVAENRELIEATITSNVVITKHKKVFKTYNNQYYILNRPHQGDLHCCANVFLTLRAFITSASETRMLSIMGFIPEFSVLVRKYFV